MLIFYQKLFLIANNLILFLIFQHFKEIIFKYLKIIISQNCISIMIFKKSF